MSPSWSHRRHLSRFPAIFILDDVEVDLFHNKDELIFKAGCWARFLDYLLQILKPSDEGSICGIEWRIAHQNIILKNGEKLWIDRVQRWIEVKVGKDRLIISLEPHLYVQKNKHYVDHRFVVRCTSAAIAPLVLLFGEHIVGE